MEVEENLHGRESFEQGVLGYSAQYAIRVNSEINFNADIVSLLLFCHVVSN